MSEQLVSLVLFAMIVTYSPGPNNVLLAWSGGQVGVWRTFPLWLGIVVGIVAIVAVSAMGLGAIIHAQPNVQLAMKLIGSAYLAWLGWKVAHSGPPDFERVDGSARTGFVAGFINTMLNPKGWAMALSATAGYAALAPNAPQLALVLSLVFVLVAVPNWILWSGGGQVMARSISSARGWRIANAVLGLLVVLSVVPLWLE
ncbi:MAG TPA: LysE family transporter [Thermomicrobiales bacterium]|nr:LysE family transporter [Thermomicrobiales bacterium]